MTSAALERLRSSGALLDAVVGSMSDVVFVLDRECRYYGIWGSWLERHGLTAHDYIGKTCAEVWGEEDAAFFDEVHGRVFAGETVVFERWFEMPWGPVYYQSTLSPLVDGGEVIGVCGIRRDLTDLKRAEDAVRRQKEYATSLVECANVMVVGLDLSGRVRVFNQVAEEVTGYAASDVLGEDWFELVVPRERFPQVWGAFERLHVRDDDERWPRSTRRCWETPILTRSGEERIVEWMESEVPDPDRETDVICFGVDVTDSRERQRMLEHMATHDPLTGLPNRRSFESALGRACARAQRGTVSAVLFIDVDDFKLCNDQHGHAFGDAVLTEIARVMELQVREPDIVARIGGDEFAALLEGATVAEAEAVAARMRDGVARMAGQRGIDLDLSVGVMGVDASVGYEHVLTGADTAMYASKRSGAGVVVYEPEST